MSGRAPEDAEAPSAPDPYEGRIKTEGPLA